MKQIMSFCFARTTSSRLQMSGTCSSLKAIARLAASLGSARRFAARTSHGSIIAVVNVPWLTAGPKPEPQGKPEVYRTAVLNERKYLGREALWFEGSHFRAVLLALAPLQRLLVDGELAFDAVYRAIEQVDG
ncbi:hypothetical protein [Bradyrhizobium sp. CIR3A]|uniref:hypothetical protein n=1 Tax=Bradyrhizobium sp. CIR3A TaxID=2663838 RepID=UPI0016060220|nr:hypothetical protein [Bradyrhizobium sp. CIR3A]MBB4264074.1 hypothetical protein [Bradyrhizobium sp. CIR3A]